MNGINDSYRSKKSRLSAPHPSYWLSPYRHQLHRKTRQELVSTIQRLLNRIASLQMELEDERKKTRK